MPCRSLLAVGIVAHASTPVPLLPGESCVLGSVTLAHMVSETGGRADVDWARLRHAVRVGIRFLDDVIEVNREPLPEIAEITRANRKIGLGVMGFAQCLVRLGVSYASAEAVRWADQLMGFVATEARATSGQLAESRGNFPNWSLSTYASNGEPMRNATRLSVAPTGTIGIIAGTSGSVEPLFALAYRREHTLGGTPLVELNPVVLRTLEQRGLDVTPVLEAILATGTIRDAPAVPGDLRQLLVTATEIPVGQHLRIQQAFQHHVDNAVSKTINLPEDAPRGDVAEAFREGWRLGLKGITVHRSGSRADQILTLGAGEDPMTREAFAKCDPGACRL